MHCCIHALCTVHTNQVTEFKCIVLLRTYEVINERVWRLDWAPDAAGGGLECETLLKQRKAVEAFTSVYVLVQLHAGSYTHL